VRARGARAGSRLIARVQPLVTARSIDRTFDYGVPDGVELESGSRVLVPLGARQVDGVVVDVAEGDDEELKPIDEVIGRVPPALLELAVWMADEYGSTLARALALVIPPRPPKRALKARDDFPDPDVAVVRRLTDAQRAAVAGCLEATAAGEREVLLHGVTGSGKTEVYLAVIERALEQGRGAVVLVPEIALTPQTAGRFVARFGDTVAVLHSALTPARRGAEHARIAAGEARVVVGARSAVFAAMPDLGVIVIDEEHDGSYKHESDPRYDARRVAAKRARIEGAIAIYGSATPRPEAWQGIRRRLELPARIGGMLPRVEVVDLRRDGGYPFTRPLLDALAGIDDHGGRAILLQNRRGAAAALHCRTCARSWRCPRCDVSLVLHGRALLVCHHCGLRERAPAACPACGSVDLARIGAGTERVELDLVERFPRLEVLRLDADVASRAGEPAATLERFRAADRAVLVGTQIVAKGHDVPGVELAAVLDAETGLAVPDFRAEERTFALLTQLAGRPGRPGDERGRVIVQAWEPDGRPVALAARHAVGEFLDGELERRAELGYPPYRRLVRLLVTAPETDVAQGVAEALEAAARPVLDGDALLGPAPIGRLRDRARSHLLVKTLDPRRAAVVFRGLLRDLAPDMRRADATAVVDVDPQTRG
jgi:primosomal protein N' (replication factor Y)